MKHFAIIAALVATTACSAHIPERVSTSGPNRLANVVYDEGGNLLDHMNEVRGMGQRGEGMRITGVCMSSCFLYLRLPATCVSPDASIMWHKPYDLNPAGGLVITHDEHMQIVAKLTPYIPVVLQDWYVAEGWGKTTWWSGQELIDMGATTECP